MTFCHFLPPSRVTWISPSSVPTQTRSFSIGDGAMVAITPKPQALARETGTSPVAQSGVPGTAPERSGLTVCQVWPRSVERKSTWAPR